MSLVDFGKRLLECAKQGDTEEVRLLMTNGAPFTTDWLGTSPLHVAAEHGHVTTAEVLLRAGISRDARTKVDRTPLHIAAQEGHTAVVELLIKHGAEVNAKDMLQMTPLHWAVERGHIPVIMCLLNHNANVKACSKFNKTALDIAEDNCRMDIMKMLKDHINTSPKESRDKKLATSLPKHPLILPKPVAVPFKVIKSEVTSNSYIEKVNIKDGRTQSNISVVQTSSNENDCGSTSAKSSVIHPVLLQSYSSKSIKDSKTCSDSDEGNASDQSCTNVLTTLAALAEATAPNATISTQEALQWLETHGITMLPADNSTIVASALEGGQTVSLTEAGKLALTWVKEHRQLQNSSSQEDSSKTKDYSDCSNMKNKTESANQLITIVSNKPQTSSIISGLQAPLSIDCNESINDTDYESLPKLKKIKTDEIKLAVTNLLGKNIPPLSNGEITPEEEKIILQKELEKIKKQAEEYKAQLLLKEHEAEAYRKQLEELKNSTKKKNL